MLHAAEADSRDRSETHPEFWSSNLPNTCVAKIHIRYDAMLIQAALPQILAMSQRYKSFNSLLLGINRGFPVICECSDGKLVKCCTTSDSTIGGLSHLCCCMRWLLHTDPELLLQCTNHNSLVALQNAEDSAKIES